MIKINLLPVRAARKKENIRRQVSIFSLCILFGICVMVYLTMSMSHKISVINEDIQVAQAELKKFEAIGKQVREMRRELKKLEDKMDIIVRLEANRTGPVRFMDALTGFVVPDKMWLTAISEKQGTLSLSGMASDNKVVADFMTSLEQSPQFGEVDLVSSKQVDLQQGRKYKRFTVSCGLASGKPQNKPKKS
jgi:type IV pilus assembly protein PilN